MQSNTDDTSAPTKALTLESLRADGACAESIRLAERLLLMPDKSEALDILWGSHRSEAIWWASNGYDVVSDLTAEARERHNVARTASNSGYGGTASNSGDGGTASNSGDRGTASNSGYGGTASNSGDGGTASNSGDLGTASNSGYRGTASNSGYRGTASNSGYRGTASNSGDRGTASNSGTKGIAVCLGSDGRVSGSAGSALALTWWDEEADRPRLAVAYVGEAGIKPDTLYRCVRGEFVEGPHA
jgi:hypothetical protein